MEIYNHFCVEVFYLWQLLARSRELNQESIHLFTSIVLKCLLTDA